MTVQDVNIVSESGDRVVIERHFERHMEGIENRSDQELRAWCITQVGAAMWKHAQPDEIDALIGACEQLFNYVRNGAQQKDSLDAFLSDAVNDAIEGQ